MYHTLDNIRNTSLDLANWLIRQRAKYKEQSLPQDMIDKLNEIGIIWNFNDIWSSILKLPKSFMKKTLIPTFRSVM